VASRRRHDSQYTLCYTACMSSWVERRIGSFSANRICARPMVPRLGILLLAILLTLWTGSPRTFAQDDETQRQHFVEPGDTWSALSWRYGIDAAALRGSNLHMNWRRQPAIGTFINIIGESYEAAGTLVTSSHGGLLEMAVEHGFNPWRLARLNNLDTPFRPLLYRAIYVPGGSLPPRQLPPGFKSLELSHPSARPGEAMAIRVVTDEEGSIEAFLSDVPFALFRKGRNLVGLVGTGAFYPAGEHELRIVSQERQSWSQPWQMDPGEWTFQSLTLTGEAAAIDQEAIRLERERLDKIWQLNGDEPLWETTFQQPITDYLSVSSLYGARRSYNGGPFSTYHEGVDFSAPAGTSVYAPAKGTIAVAERLFVRGGTVIIDHGFGVYSGTYHLSEVLVEVGQTVSPGQLVGKVGSTGLSTGNHLHWDLLVGGTWVNAAAWLEQDLACWILDGWGTGCHEPLPG
jgi:murein DD-endopeptidase MepM/ murein hydrolase activator NlpD